MQDTFNRVLLILVSTFLLHACSVTDNKKHLLQNVVDEYYTVYSERTDFERFMAFYDDQAQLEVLAGKPVLTLSKHVIDGRNVITEGYFNQFKYNGQVLGPWLFVIVHQFNDKNKIIKQTDWINYTPRKQFLGGKNMNQGLHEK